MRTPARVAIGMLATALVACGGGTPAPPRPTIVVLQSTDTPEGLDVVSPAVLGFTLALRESALAVRVLPADPAGISAATAAADPMVIGAVVAPFTVVGSTAAQILGDADLPVLTLAGLDETPAGASWRAMVPDARVHAAAIVDAAAAFSVDGCLVSESGSWSAIMAAMIADAGAGSDLHPASSMDGCAVVVWSGSAGGAASLRASSPLPIVLTDQARTERYLAETADLAGVTNGSCGCRDLSTSAEPADQAFVHAYQETTGLDPGPYAAEGYDAGGLILGALGAAEPTRDGFADAIGRVGSFAGVARTYAWSPSGELVPSTVHIYRAEGVRWLLTTAAGG